MFDNRNFECKKSNKILISVSTIIAFLFLFIGSIVLDYTKPSLFEDSYFRIPLLIVIISYSILSATFLSGILITSLCFTNEDEKNISLFIDNGHLIEKLPLSENYFKPHIEKKTIALRVFWVLLKFYLWAELVILLIILISTLLLGNQMMDNFFPFQIVLTTSCFIGYFLVFVFITFLIKYNRYYIDENNLIIMYNNFSFWTIRNEIPLSMIKSVLKLKNPKYELPFPPHNIDENLMVKITFKKDLDIVHYKEKGMMKNLYIESKYNHIILPIQDEEAREFIGGLNE